MSYRSTASDLNDLATQTIDESNNKPSMKEQGMEGNEADTFEDTMTRLHLHVGDVGMSMQELVDILNEQSDADDELQRHPKPADIKRQYMKFKMTQDMDDFKMFAEMERDRKQALAEHTSKTEGVIARMNALVIPELPPELHGPAYGPTVLGSEDTGYVPNEIKSLIDPSTSGGSGGSGGGYNPGAGLPPSMTSNPAAQVSTHTSADTEGTTRPQTNALGSMQPMQAQPQPQGAQPGGASPMGGGFGGTPLKDMGLKPLPKEKKDDRDLGFDPKTNLSGDGALGAVTAGGGHGDNLGPKNGTSISGVNSKSDTSGFNKPAVSATGTPPGGGQGGAMMGRGGGMMGSGAGGQGAEGKVKKRDDTISAIQDRILTGQITEDNAVTGGLISRESSKPPTFEDGNMLDPSKLPKDFRDRAFPNEKAG